MAEYMWTTHAPLGRTVRGNGVGVGRGESKRQRGRTPSAKRTPPAHFWPLSGMVLTDGDALIQKGHFGGFIPAKKFSLGFILIPSIKFN